MVRKQNKHNASLNRIWKQNEHLSDPFECLPLMMANSTLTVILLTN